MRHQYVIITRNKDWGSTGFICEAYAAAAVVKAMNDQEELIGAPADWQVTTVELTSSEAEETRLAYIKDNI